MGFQVVLHEGVVDDTLRPPLANGIQRIYAAIFGGAADAVEVTFTEIPAGHMFTAGEPSRSSLVSGGVPAGTSKADRTRLLTDITSLWCEVTGCSPNELVVSAGDAPA